MLKFEQPTIQPKAHSKHLICAKKTNFCLFATKIVEHIMQALALKLTSHTLHKHGSTCVCKCKTIRSGTLLLAITPRAQKRQNALFHFLHLYSSCWLTVCWQRRRVRS